MKISNVLTVGVAALALTGCGAAQAAAPPSPSAPAPSSGAPAVNTPIRLAYSVSSQPGATVTYRDPTDDSTQQLTTTATSWAQNFSGTLTNASLGLPLYISVQNGINSQATVACSITVNGAVVDTHSTAGYDIATCQYNYTGG